MYLDSSNDRCYKSIQQAHRKVVQDLLTGSQGRLVKDPLCSVCLLAHLAQRDRLGDPFDESAVL